MRPQDALGPRGRLEPASLDVFCTAPDGSWSFAKVMRDSAPGVGCRWDKGIDDPEDRGNPRGRAHGTWFVLPDEVGFPLMTLAQTFQQACE